MKPDGKLLGLVLKYKLCNDYVKELVIDKMEGLINPTEKQLKVLFKKSDLKLDWIQTIPVPELHNYPEAIFFEAKLK